MPSINDEMATGADIDYSDFEYQFANLTPQAEGGSPFNYEFDVLEGRGGLDNNEVAELVYIETQASLEYELDAGANDQDVATAGELRGLVGANIDGGNGINGLGQRVDTNINSPGTGFVATDDRVFQLFEARGAPGFDDETSGPGGNTFTTSTLYTKNWRELVGRGPVLDSSDNITVDGLVIAGDTLAGITLGNIRLHMVFDTAEVSDAGRAFSVPGM